MSDAPTDPTVYKLRLAGVAERYIVDALAQEKRVLFERLILLEHICPRRYRVINGDIFVWHCPDHLIPITDFPPTTPVEGQPKTR